MATGDVANITGIARVAQSLKELFLARVESSMDARAIGHETLQLVVARLTHHSPALGLARRLILGFCHRIGRRIDKRRRGRRRHRLDSANTRHKRLGGPSPSVVGHHVLDRGRRRSGQRFKGQRGRERHVWGSPRHDWSTCNVTTVSRRIGRVCARGKNIGRGRAIRCIGSRDKNVIGRTHGKDAGHSRDSGGGAGRRVTLCGDVRTATVEARISAETVRQERSQGLVQKENLLSRQIRSARALHQQELQHGLAIGQQSHVRLHLVRSRNIRRRRGHERCGHRWTAIDIRISWRCG